MKTEYSGRCGLRFIKVDSGSRPPFSSLNLQYVQRIMSKRQVISVSLVAAIPAVGLLVFLILNALKHGGSMSGLLGTFVAISALLSLLVAIAPLLMMVWYPAEGFVTAMPEAPAPEAVEDEDEDEFETDGFDDEYDDSEMGSDEEYEDDEYEDFEDDDEWE